MEFRDFGVGQRYKLGDQVEIEIVKEGEPCTRLYVLAEKRGYLCT